MQAKSEELVNNINDTLIDIRNAIIKKEFPEHEHPTKTHDTVEKIRDFNKQQKVKDSRYQTNPPKKILQRLPIALAEVKVANTSKNLLNRIRQVIYSLYQAKEIIQKVYNKIMNWIKL